MREALPAMTRRDDQWNPVAMWHLSAAIFFVLTVLCLFASAIDHRLIHGVSVWSKPFKFALSLGVYFATFLWFARLLPDHHLGSRKHRRIGQSLVFVAIFEFLYIAAQASLGELSHFNKSTAFHSTMYSLMGLGAIWLTVGLLWLSVLIGKTNDLAKPFVLAVVVGLVLSACLGGGFGIYLGSQTSHWVDAIATDATGIWLFNWSTSGGDLRVAHFFGLHAMQVIPLCAMSLPTRLTPKAQMTILIIVSGIYSAWSLFTFVQATQGLPFIA